ncbi:ABC transporter ATP-binding protein [Gymnodinialimonas ceratoperidinii]|uniref:ABC transporter ATP-binding protein n=1 Tax=Gymnodinialimonas ceratoperidinii TaxID=2856823 RepID=A0A8F6YDJ4_9RHOB|nr:ABC transporter ATP-binding protein [Gymnodinialimonas ceratoperidinii]QXT40252.1 ABC transporter ATP-binding protein [Gymnodinialimonas ceratoperidinii]
MLHDDTAPPAGTPLLQVRDLQTTFDLSKSLSVCAVDGVSFDVHAGETLAIVGESGSGKSVTSLSIMGLLPKDVGRISGGSIKLHGREITDLSDAEMRDIRGKEIGMIFQEPMTSLNPVHTIGQQISEMVIRHEKLSAAKARARAIEMLDLVGIPEPTRRVDNYPHEMSGGMRQRAMIAMALACEPRILIADEPTTALDVTIQAQMLELMEDLQKKLGMAIIFITHDLGVVAEVADRVVVMYAAQVVETASVEDIFANPRMPYTAGLMNSIPRLGSSINKTRLEAIPGTVPALTNLPQGCRFHPRCAFATERCTAAEPPLEVAADGHLIRCVRWQELNLSERQAS